MRSATAPLTIRISSAIDTYGEILFSQNEDNLFCKPCKKIVNVNHMNRVTQHLRSKKHLSLTSSTNSSSESSTIVANDIDDTEFSSDLCKALIDAGIPLTKLHNSSFNNFLHKYTGRAIPDESTLRKRYVASCYDKTIQNIRDNVGDSNIWVSVDETTDVTGRFVVNVVIGTMRSEETSKIYLLTCEEIEKTNSTTIAQTFTKALNDLWPNGVQFDRVLLLVTDAAAYMKKAGLALKVLYPNMIHVTCLAHGLHRIAEHVRELHPKVDKLVANVKKVFLKSPSRIQHFKEIAPDLSLPPQPVLTRWGTWISAVLYYALHWDTLKLIFDGLNSDSASSIKIAKEILEDDVTRNNVSYISTYFEKIPTAISSLEKNNLELSASLKIFDDISNSLCNLPGTYSSEIKKKFDHVRQNNADLKEIEKLASIFKGEQNVSINLTPSQIMSYRYAPLTSTEVERSFSAYKNFLTDRRHNFKFENIKKFMVIQCNEFC